MKTAVILAARKEHDSMTPYPLLPNNGGAMLVGAHIEYTQ